MRMPSLLVVAPMMVILLDVMKPRCFFENTDLVLRGRVLKKMSSQKKESMRSGKD
jgi:hypothetical protein